MASDLERITKALKKHDAWWTELAERECFDDRGTLVADLYVHWRGDRNAIAKALASTKLTIEGGLADAQTFTIKMRRRKRPSSWIRGRCARAVARKPRSRITPHKKLKGWQVLTYEGGKRTSSPTDRVRIRPRAPKQTRAAAKQTSPSPSRSSRRRP